ncbi:MAG TPA: DciA family protein [Steroidobacteraceae bacterium]|nr:DciA family protein [Steroidobacteraceae bacterium]
MPAPHSVKDVLSRLTPTLTRVCAQAGRQDFWREWLAAHLPESLLPRLSGVVEREGILVVFAESAAWSARLRYAMQELEPRIRDASPQISGFAVRVLPQRRRG